MRRIRLHGLLVSCERALRPLTTRRHSVGDCPDAATLTSDFVRMANEYQARCSSGWIFGLPDCVQTCAYTRMIARRPTRLSWAPSSTLPSPLASGCIWCVLASRPCLDARRTIIVRRASRFDSTSAHTRRSSGPAGTVARSGASRRSPTRKPSPPTRAHPGSFARSRSGPRSCWTSK